MLTQECVPKARSQRLLPCGVASFRCSQQCSGLRPLGASKQPLLGYHLALPATMGTGQICLSGLNTLVTLVKESGGLQFTFKTPRWYWGQLLLYNGLDPALHLTVATFPYIFLREILEALGTDLVHIEVLTMRELKLGSFQFHPGYLLLHLLATGAMPREHAH